MAKSFPACAENVLYQVFFLVCNAVTAGYFHLMPLIPILEEIIDNHYLFTSSQLHNFFFFPTKFYMLLFGLLL